jgi:hypothetical protein
MTVKQMDQTQADVRKPDLQTHYGTIRLEAVVAASLFKAPAPKPNSFSAVLYDQDQD